jgi:hypothetical protein
MSAASLKDALYQWPIARSAHDFELRSSPQFFFCLLDEVVVTRAVLKVALAPRLPPYNGLRCLAPA